MFTEPDPQRLEQLLIAQLPGARDVAVGELTRVFGGNARRAWSFDATWRHAQGSSELSAVVLVQVEPGQVAADPAHEFRVLRALRSSQARVPGALAVDPIGAVLGAPALVLERMPGAANLSAFLRPVDPESSRLLTVELAIAAADVHNTVWSAAELGAMVTEPRAAVAAQVADWRSQFERARFEPHPVLASLYGWLERNLPTPPALSVVHGDLRPGNFLHEAGRLTALLDWEMAHLGDPAEDLAWAYRPLWSPEPFLAIDDFLAVYNERTDHPVTPERLRYYRIFSEAKFATISLRAARAYHDGAASNLRLADRAVMVTACARRGLELVGSGVDA